MDEPAARSEHLTCPRGAKRLKRAKLQRSAAKEER